MSAQADLSLRWAHSPFIGFVLLQLKCPHIWAASWQNQQNGMCAQQRLRSAWTTTQSDQSLLCAQWVAKDTSFLHETDAQADLSLHWAHMPFCWFCHGVARFWSFYQLTFIFLSSGSFCLSSLMPPCLSFFPLILSFFLSMYSFMLSTLVFCSTLYRPGADRDSERDHTLSEPRHKKTCLRGFATM